MPKLIKLSTEQEQQLWELSTKDVTEQEFAYSIIDFAIQLERERISAMIITEADHARAFAKTLADGSHARAKYNAKASALETVANAVLHGPEEYVRCYNSGT
jgi:hypothetical protein